MTKDELFALIRETEAFEAVTVKVYPDNPEKLMFVPGDDYDAVEGWAASVLSAAYAANMDCDEVWQALGLSSNDPPAPCQLGTQWRDIESAPRDGSPVILWPLHLEDETRATVGHWYVHPAVQGFITPEMNCNDFEFEPTHWLPWTAFQGPTE